MDNQEIQIPTENGLRDLLSEAYNLEVITEGGYKRNYELFLEASRLHKALKETLCTLYKVKDILEWLEDITNKNATAYRDSQQQLSDYVCSTVKTKVIHKIEDVDYEALPMSYLTPDEKRIELALTAGTVIPGVTATEIKTQTLRSK
jgi:hypothetical protein